MPKGSSASKSNNEALNVLSFGSFYSPPLYVSDSELCCQKGKISYIVYMGESSFSPSSSSGEKSFSESSLTTLDVKAMTKSHFDMLGTYLDSKEKVEDQMLYSYTRCINGFSAVLDEAQVAALNDNPGVVSIFENKENRMYTTHSWDFLGFEKNGVPSLYSLQKKANFGEDIIIGNLDSGVWPESKSFNDEGMGPVPSKWKGTCDDGGGVTCNKKLIGARYFNKGFAANNGPVPEEWNTARDDASGHGTHTLSTAGGSYVPGFYEDGISIGSLHAIKKGIPVIAAGGNNGPSDGSITNGAPWLFTIGASTMDREIFTTVTLGDKKLFKGKTLASKNLPDGKLYPLINGAEAALAEATPRDAQLCLDGTLDPNKVSGKIILCLRGQTPRLPKGYEAERAGAAGMILANDIISGDELYLEAYELPSAHITYVDGESVMEYIKETRNPTASISPAITSFGEKPSPAMAKFSSRGPSKIEPAVLKFQLQPDITAPGVDVIAAFTGAIGPSRRPFDKRRTPYMNFSLADFNYPSITVPDLKGPVTVTRRVKNVGAPGTYTVSIKAPAKVSVVVEPSSLEFKQAGEEQLFKLTFKPIMDGMPKDYEFGHLTWSDGLHRVKSPLSYIVYMGQSSFSPLSSTGESSFSELDVQKMTQSHFDLLGSCLESKENVQDVMIYSYTKCLNGFAAYLNEAQVAAMKGNPGVISVFENQERILHTTHSWEFLGFEANGAPTLSSLQKKANFGEGVIIANLDTGKVLSMKLQGKNLNYVHIGSLPIAIPSYIFWLRTITIGVWPESKSFNDEGMGPVPSRWKGTCQAGGGFKCNKKLIGARYFNKGFASASPTPIPTEWNTARDTEGHGSHTLSTAGGSFVPGAEFLQDGMAIGSFHAIKKGIPVVASAGNNGPVAGSVAHGAPWLFTIGASTLDREFSATVALGNKKFVKGSSAASKSLPAGKFYPLINAAEARLPTASSADAQLCQNGTLDPKKVSGKIIVCLRGINSRVVKGHEAELAGAVGMILANDEESGSELLSDPHVLPAAQLTFTDGVPYKCPENASLAEFNYPSITVPDLNGPVTVTRRVKNVGAPGTYTVKVEAPPKVSVVVEPSSLEFKKAGEEKIFKVTFKPVADGMPKDYTFGHLTWSDSNGHLVKSPLVVKHA
ncbi:hypothetical protein POTOM_007035 [Populus tomentosa]|uniref:Subtilisin-like protease SBT5.3 n=1 Tax=Populus tomentosa TaxID=118781 RepID=A0A8X8D7Z7_POPTO|nr:hypothetical protein POTOM_007035 [Populus tomentosa]